MPEEQAGDPVLTNGDTLAGVIRGMGEGKVSIEGELGAMEVPANKIRTIDFGGSAAPESAPARLHLADGSVLHVDQYRCDATGDFRA